MLTSIINSILSKAKVELKCVWKKIALIMHQKVETINIIDSIYTSEKWNQLYLHTHIQLFIAFIISQLGNMFFQS